MKIINVYDIAVFLSIADLSYLQERKLIKTLHEALSPTESLSKFMIEVDEQLEQLDDQVMNEMIEIESTRNGKIISGRFNQDMAHYLKVIKLRIQYTETDYVKIKFRTLLKKLGYKRRSDKLVMELHEMFESLDLVLYKKGGILSEIFEFSLDEFITIRLRSDNHVEK